MSDTNHKQIVYNLFKQHLKSIGIVSLVINTRGFKRYYFMAFFVIIFILVILKGLPVWLFVFPFIPLILIWLLYIVDLNIMIQCLVKIQKILIEQHQLAYDLNQLLDELQDYAKENSFFQIGSR